MASLKEMRNRIGSVKATQKITKAMQMVAAAKLRRAQDNAQNARPYADRMRSVMGSLSRAGGGDFRHAFRKRGEIGVGCEGCGREKKQGERCARTIS